jgi:hypothetical protein
MSITLAIMITLLMVLATFLSPGLIILEQILYFVELFKYDRWY